jgi:acetoacetyl-CoA reductase
MNTVLITGCSSGFGLDTASYFLDRGWTVIATMRAPREDLLPPSDHLRILPLDVTDAGSIARAVDAAGPIDVLVNNAGITRDSQLHRMKPEQWSAVINTNLGSLFNMCRQVIEGMRERKFGRIVNISSINGQKGQFGQVNYSAAKAGEIGFTKALAQEGARVGVTVNAICPGYIATDMVKAMSQEVLQKSVLPQIPIGRLGEPEEVARCVVFLASDDAGLITGSTLTANGGQYFA